MVSDGRYIANEETFKQHAYSALISRFRDTADFEGFYASLKNAAIKDKFLRVTTFYLFLVKRGDWQVAVEGCRPVIDYFTNSFKLVALFSLIESLSDKEPQDFYSWLCNESSESVFPISNRSALSTLNDRYKASYGSIRRCIVFFEGLPPHRQKALCNAIKISGKPLASVKEVAAFLYDLRSKSVHEARFVLQVSGDTVLSMKRNKVVETQLSIEALLEAFEDGILVYFGQKKITLHCT